MTIEAQTGTWLKRQWRMVQGRVRTGWRPHQLYLFDRTASLLSVDAAVSAFGQWCEAHPGAVCAIGLSGRWVLSSVSQIDADHDAAYGHALQQWSHYLDIDQATLESDWVLRQLALPHVSLLCATPRTLTDGLRTQAAQHGVRLQWVGPWWTRRVQAWLASLDEADDAGASAPSQHEFVVYEPGLLTHVRAHVHEPDGARLGDIWTEVTSEAVPMAAMQHGASLMPPPADGISGLPYDSHIWSHGAVAEVLQGRLPASTTQASVQEVAA